MGIPLSVKLRSKDGAKEFDFIIDSDFLDERRIIMYRNMMYSYVFTSPTTLTLNYGEVEYHFLGDADLRG